MAEKYDRDGIPIAHTKRPTRGPFALAAPYYLERGYLSLPVRGKRLLVKGSTGFEGVVTPEKVAQWHSDFPSADIALRAEGWLGIDIDDHDGKKGGAQLAELEDRLGPLPETYSSTSRGRFANSRIYLYRVEQDMRRRSRAAKHIDVIHKFHRYMVVFPSAHPRTGETYHWYGLEGELRAAEGPPRPSELPLLPPAWDEYLKKGDEQNSRSNSPHKPFGGSLEDWQQSLDDTKPSAAAVQLHEDISRCSHIGHDELLFFVGEIECPSNGSEYQGLKTILEVLSTKYFAETNETNPGQEWENILRWFISEDWEEKASSWRSFSTWVSQVAFGKGVSNA